MKLGEFAELFRLVLSQYQVGTIPVSLDRVTCRRYGPGQPQHCSGALSAGGGRRQPAPGERPAGLLTDEDRTLLAYYGSVETALDQEGQMEREMLLIYKCATMPSRRLYAPKPGGGESARRF